MHGIWKKTLCDEEGEKIYSAVVSPYIFKTEKQPEYFKELLLV